MQYKYDPGNDNPLEEIAARIRRMRNNRLLGPLLITGLIAVIVIWGLLSGIYTVKPEGKAVVKRFGRVVDIVEPGLHFKLPWGIDVAYFVPTERVLKMEFGFATAEAGQQSTFVKQEVHRKQSLMLTGDLNVIDVEWVVQYRISDPDLWLHALKNQEETIRVISESVMRRVVGNKLGSIVLTTGRSDIAAEAREEVQRILDQYKMGVHISTVEMQDVTPPDPVKPAFNEVNEARQQREQFINEAERRQKEVLPRVEGEAQKMLAEARGYQAQRTNAALGEAARFKAIYGEYKEAREVTRRRLYLEMIDQVMSSAGKVYIVEEGQPSPLPLLNLGGSVR